MGEKMMPKLIVLYGPWSNQHNGKQQMMIDGKCTCGYRDYAKAFGEIIYLSPQNVKLSWEKSMVNPDNIIKYVNSQPDAIVWVVKHDPNRDSKIVKRIKNKKLYYSCNAVNCTNKYCDVSLVDTPERAKKCGGNAKVFFKGKDQGFWLPNGGEKEYDYLLMGRRADKNELYFLKTLNMVDEIRRILWIGGDKHKDKISTKHNCVTTPFSGPMEVKELIPKAKVGILMTEHPAEGFPQSFLEMTMCGLPVLYTNTAPSNEFYFKEGVNCKFSPKKAMAIRAEELLADHNSEACREFAVNNYSLEASYNKMVSLL